jgi:hypothetical protein
VGVPAGADGHRLGDAHDPEPAGDRRAWTDHQALVLHTPSPADARFTNVLRERIVR